MKKTLYKTKKDRMFFGVCSGLANYFDIEVWIIRLLFILVFFAGGSGGLIYILLAIAIPSEPNPAYPFNEVEEENINTDEMKNSEEMKNSAESPKKQNKNQFIIGLIVIAIGLFLFIDRFVMNIYWGDLWPFILIVAGIALLVHVQVKERKKTDPINIKEENREQNSTDI